MKNTEYTCKQTRPLPVRVEGARTRAHMAVETRGYIDLIAANIKIPHGRSPNELFPLKGLHHQIQADLEFFRNSFLSLSFEQFEKHHFLSLISFRKKK